MGRKRSAVGSVNDYLIRESEGENAGEAERQIIAIFLLNLLEDYPKEERAEAAVNICKYLYMVAKDMWDDLRKLTGGK